MNKKERMNIVFNYLRGMGLIHTQKDLAKKMNTTPPNVSSALKGVESVLTDSFMIRLNSSFGNVFNTDWLIYGEGDMLVADVHHVEETEPQEYTTNKSGARFLQDGSRLLMEVPKVERNALGSMGDEWAPDTSDNESTKERFEVDSVHHGSYVCFEVDGDSMDDGTEAGFRRGDVVLVRHLAREHWQSLHFSKWPYWVVVFGNNVRLKQIIAQDEKSITLHSLNPSPEYTDFTLNLNEVTHLYNVITKKPRQVNYGGF